MKTKICTGCGKEKSVDEFYKAISNKDGYGNNCKSCKIKYQKEYSQNNKEKISLERKKYGEKNKEKITAYKKNWVQENKDHVNKKQRKRIKKRRQSDLRYKIKENIQSLFRESFRKQNLKKKMSIRDYTGFDIEHYYKYLKKSKYSKDYLQKNKIEIDHIIPCNAYDFNNLDDIKKCWNPKNLRLLPNVENKKKHHKIDMDLIKKYSIKHLLPK